MEYDARLYTCLKTKQQAATTLALILCGLRMFQIVDKREA
jgi:hypothetical protein